MLSLVIGARMEVIYERKDTQKYSRQDRDVCKEVHRRMLTIWEEMQVLIRHIQRDKANSGN